MVKKDVRAFEVRLYLWISSYKRRNAEFGDITKITMNYF